MSLLAGDTDAITRTIDRLWRGGRVHHINETVLQNPKLRRWLVKQVRDGVVIVRLDHSYPKPAKFWVRCDHDQ